MADGSLEGLNTDQIETLARLAKTMGDKPETRKQFQQMVKTINPSAHFVELEVDEKVSAAVKATTEELEKMRAERDQEKQITARNNVRQKLMNEGLIESDADFEDVEKVMAEKLIGSHETAARFRANERQLAAPAAEVPGRGGPMYMPQEAKQFFKNPTQTSRKLAHEVVTDLMQKRNKGSRAFQ